MKQLLRLTVLGTRGSMAACRSDCRIFGGDTSCYMVQAGDETIFLDGGSGITTAPAIYPKPPVILLSHVHLDHIMGLGMFTGFFVPGQHARIYVPDCEDKKEAEQRLDQVFSPPTWPLKLSQLEGKPEILPMLQSFSVGRIRVDTQEGNHPNGAVVIRLSCEGASIVYATDYEYSEESFARLARFAAGTDLILYDAQYTEDEYVYSRGFGHSTPDRGIELLHKSGAGRMLLVHHSPSVSDDILFMRENQINHPRVSFARQGEEIIL